MIGVVEHRLGHHVVMHQQLFYFLYASQHAFYKQANTIAEERFAKFMCCNVQHLSLSLFFVFYQASLILECIWTQLQHAHIEGQHMWIFHHVRVWSLHALMCIDWSYGCYYLCTGGPHAEHCTIYNMRMHVSASAQCRRSAVQFEKKPFFRDRIPPICFAVPWMEKQTPCLWGMRVEA